MYRKICSMISAVLFLTVCLTGSYAYSAPNNEQEFYGLESVLENYHDSVDKVKSANNAASNVLNNLRDQRDEALVSLGYNVYRVNNKSYDTVSKLLNTDLEEIGLSNEGSYLVIVGSEKKV